LLLFLKDFTSTLHILLNIFRPKVAGTGTVPKNGPKLVLFIARLFIVSPFVFDAYQMVYGWPDERNLIETKVKVGSTLASMTALYYITAQIGASVTFLFR
jgi:hypothetical protein